MLLPHPTLSVLLLTNNPQCWIAFELVFVYFLYIETKGVPLEEIAKIFDGEDAEVGVADKNFGFTSGAETLGEKEPQVHTERV